MIARTLIKTIETQTIDIKLYMMFLVAINKTTNEKIIAIIIPYIADDTNDCSVGIQAQAKPAV